MVFLSFYLFSSIFFFFVSIELFMFFAGIPSFTCAMFRTIAYISNIHHFSTLCNGLKFTIGFRSFSLKLLYLTYLFRTNKPKQTSCIQIRRRRMWRLIRIRKVCHSCSRFSHINSQWEVIKFRTTVLRSVRVRIFKVFMVPIIT